MTEEPRQNIEALIRTAEATIPIEMQSDLPPVKFSDGVPDWHPFEYEIWEIGEKIRQFIFPHKALRNDRGLQNAFVRVSTNRCAKRGRQSFVMLLGYRCCVVHAASIASQLDDPCVQGHAIDVLLKMNCGDYVEEVAELTNHPRNWIRKSAYKYVRRFGSSDNL